MGIDPSTVNRWWKGKVDPHPKSIRKVADFFGCNVEWLETGKGEMWPSKRKKPYQNEGAEGQNHLNNTYRKLAQLDEETLQEIQTWLNEMEKQKPGFKSWFRLEFQNRFPEFEKWRERNISG